MILFIRFWGSNKLFQMLFKNDLGVIIANDKEAGKVKTGTIGA